MNIEEIHLMNHLMEKTKEEFPNWTREGKDLTSKDLRRHGGRESLHYVGTASGFSAVPT